MLIKVSPWTKRVVEHLFEYQRWWWCWPGGDGPGHHWRWWRSRWEAWLWHAGWDRVVWLWWAAAVSGADLISPSHHVSHFMRSINTLSAFNETPGENYWLVSAAGPRLPPHRHRLELNWVSAGQQWGDTRHFVACFLFTIISSSIELFLLQAMYMIVCMLYLYWLLLFSCFWWWKFGDDPPPGVVSVQESGVCVVTAHLPLSCCLVAVRWRRYSPCSALSMNMRL